MSRRTVSHMSDHIPDPYLSQTGYDVGEGEDLGEFDDEEIEFEAEDADDELAIEEERARER